MSSERCVLQPDRRGVVWDSLLYIPTCAGLGVGASIFWYQGNQSLSYLMLFLASFFLFQAINRVLGRMLLLPTAPVALEVSKQRVVVEMRNGRRIELVKNVRYFPDFAGKSFGLAGLDLDGLRKQFVFHQGQFVDDETFKKTAAALKVFN